MKQRTDVSCIVRNHPFLNHIWLKMLRGRQHETLYRTKVVLVHLSCISIYIYIYIYIKKEKQTVEVLPFISTFNLNNPPEYNTIKNN